VKRGKSLYYIDRTDLGKKMALRIGALGSVQPIIICLNESALSTAIALASELRGWIFPLISENIQLASDDRIIGVIDSEGQYTVNPQLSSFELEDIMSEYHGMVDDKKREAFSKINRLDNSYAKINPDILNGRLVILCGDIIRNQLQIGAARTLLKPHTPIDVIGIAGNIDVNAADYLRLTANKTEMFDVMTSMFEDDHYFEKVDSYSTEQKHSIAVNISQFWKPALSK